MKDLKDKLSDLYRELNILNVKYCDDLDNRKNTMKEIDEVRKIISRIERDIEDRKK